MPNITYKSCYYLFILLPAKVFFNFHMINTTRDISKSLQIMLLPIQTGQHFAPFLVLTVSLRLRQVDWVLYRVFERSSISIRFSLVRNSAIDSAQIKSVRKVGLTICNSGQKIISVVCIKRVNFREKVWAFGWDKRLFVIHGCIKWVSVERGFTVYRSFLLTIFPEYRAWPQIPFFFGQNIINTISVYWFRCLLKVRHVNCL